MKSVLLISHGSRYPATIAEIQSFIELLKEKCDIPIIEYAFLELMRPSIPEGIDLCVNQGGTEVIILLNFLNSGRHVDEDIPQIVEEARQKYPDVKIKISDPLGKNNKIIDLFLDIINRIN